MDTTTTPPLQIHSDHDVDSTPEITVVIGSVDSARSIEQCLASIIAAGKGFRLQVILADASSDNTLERARSIVPPPEIISRPEGTLTPILWADGIRAARGRLVALTTGHCFAPATWLSSLVSAHKRGAAAAGGPLGLGDDASVLDSAVYFLRYSAFFPDSDARPRRVHEIAGDNAMYAAHSLNRNMEKFADGFWEPEFHAALRAEGGYLEIVPEATMVFSRAFPFATIAQHRYQHGRHFGRWRVASGAQGAMRTLLAAPLVPFVLLGRATQRLWRHRHLRARFVISAPIIFALAACWATGEAAGAMEAPRAHRD